VKNEKNVYSSDSGTAFALTFYVIVIEERNKESNQGNKKVY